MERYPVRYALAVEPEILGRFEWEEIGADDPKARLLIAVSIAGVPHHLEAIAVENGPRTDSEMRPEQVASSHLYREILDHYRAADMGTDEPFLTVEIGGRQYCVFMTPYRE